MSGGYWWLVILAVWGVGLPVGLWLDNLVARRKRNRYLPKDSIAYRGRAFLDGYRPRAYRDQRQ